MTAASDFIRSLIVQEGPIPVSRFVALALSGRDDSYYMNRDPFGAQGDFITSPEISQVFGECLGAWCIDLWMQMGSPDRFRLVELGPGRGTLMSDMMRAGRSHPPFADACSVALVEVSPFLRTQQRRALAAMPAERIAWYSCFGEVPQDLPLIIIANEFFDALPARQFVRTDDGWFERCVGLDADGTFVFGALPHPDVTVQIPPQLRMALQGSIFEQCDESLSNGFEIGRALVACGGAMLAIDYGHAGPATGDTLQALKAHRHVPVLGDVGACDLTFHVDFTALAASLVHAGAHCLPLVEQGMLLQRLGAVERTAALKRKATAQQAAQLDNALVRLTSPEGMGRLFKALCAVSPKTLSPAGFVIS